METSPKMKSQVLMEIPKTCSSVASKMPLKAASTPPHLCSNAMLFRGPESTSIRLISRQICQRKNLFLGTRDRVGIPQTILILRSARAHHRGAISKILPSQSDLFQSLGLLSRSKMFQRQGRAPTRACKARVKEEPLLTTCRHSLTHRLISQKGSKCKENHKISVQCLIT